MNAPTGPWLMVVAAATVSLSGCQTLRRAKPAPPAATPAPPRPAAPPRVIVLPAPPAPTLRPCVPKALAGPPRYPDTDAALRAAPGAADRYQLLAAGRLLRQQRLDELERAILGCR